VKLPLIISVPHAGLRIPGEVEPLCILEPEEIARDGDEGAGEIYDIAGTVEEFVTTDVARAVLDMNRSEDDRRADGIVKTHTCWNVPVWRTPLTEETVDRLLGSYYRPYHARLARAARSPGVRFGVDCHTMAAKGPPIGPGAGVERPAVCLSDGDGACPSPWFERLAGCLERAFGRSVSRNDPFRGGFIIRHHARELPWVQLELSRAPFASNAEKRDAVVRALREWCSVA
jgi:formiminoglutamase